MFSSIRVLSHTYEQLIIGYASDIETIVHGEKVPASTISRATNHALEEAMADPDDNEETYFLVWQHAEIAYWNYDGYCKTSELYRLCLFPSSRTQSCVTFKTCLAYSPTPLSI